MPHNNRKFENEWIKWKTMEEIKLRELGVSEALINELRKYDESVYKKERSFRRREIITEDQYFIEKGIDNSHDDGDLESVIMELKNEVLFEIMKNMDPDLYKIIDLRVQGYNIIEISNILDISFNTLYSKIRRFQKKIQFDAQK